MKVTHLEIKGLALVELKLFGDARGFFVERYAEQRLVDAGLPGRFVQDNHSRSAPGVLRGLHFQTNPVQGKLVGVVRGRVLDVAVDLRADSPTFGQHYAVELSDLNGRLLWVPAGFGHGFCVLGEEPADVLYKVTSPYTPAGERGVMWNDPELAIRWPLENPTISGRDQKQETFAQYKSNLAKWDV